MHLIMKVALYRRQVRSGTVNRAISHASCASANTRKNAHSAKDVASLAERLVQLAVAEKRDECARLLLVDRAAHHLIMPLPSEIPRARLAQSL